MSGPGHKSTRRRRCSTAWLVLVSLMLGAGPGGDTRPDRDGSDGVFAADFRLGSGLRSGSSFFPDEPPAVNAKETTAVKKPSSTLATPKDGSAAVPAAPPPRSSEPAAAVGNSPVPSLDPRDAMRTVQTVVLFGVVSLAPVGVLMVTAFVRINIVLILLRQALGSPQVPGNQVLAALALLLTALVMRPVAEQVYERAVAPYVAGKATPAQAWEAGSKPIKAFMVDQIVRTNHQDYLWSLYHYANPPTPGRTEPVYGHEFPMRVVAPAFLLSELTTALVMGFYLYLPFLVIDLVVSAVLAAMGLFMLPPTLVAMPVKLIVFVLADGWLLVASMLLSSFAAAGP